jgi:hypothetical protein
VYANLSGNELGGFVNVLEYFGIGVCGGMGMVFDLLRG